MNKTIFVGDIHTKKFIPKSIEKLLEKDKDIDKVIFTGDYSDEWNGNEKENLDILETMFNLKRKYNDKVILLLGNHDLSYMGYPCSGHIYPDDQIIKMYKDNHELLQVIYLNEEENYIVSHGGFTQNWYDIINQYYEGTLKEKVDKINNDFQNINSEEYQSLLELLAIASVSSGSNSIYASCLWARPYDHLYHPFETMIDQIVGHTPIKDTIEIESKKTGLLEQNIIYFIDTFSTYRNRTPYGKEEVLIKIGDTYTSVNLLGLVEGDN